MNREEVRARFMNRKLRVENFDGSLPDLEDLDGQLAIQEVKAIDLDEVENLAKGPDGATVDALLTAGMVCRGLVLRDTQERIFSDTDMETVASFGMTVLKPLSENVARISRIGKYAQVALEQAKKNLPQTPDTASATSSPENSAEGVPVAN